MGGGGGGAKLGNGYLNKNKNLRKGILFMFVSFLADSIGTRASMVLLVKQRESKKSIPLKFHLLMLPDT
jgi:hypothetical protein